VTDPVSSAQILLVEDDELLSDVLRGLLKPVGEVSCVGSAEDGLSQLSSADWNLIIADIELPGMNGLEFLRIVHDQRPEIAALVVSGQAQFKYAVEAIRAGADDYVTKPVDPQALVAKVGELILRQRERRPAPGEVVLAIGAHPDDVEIGCGGILLRHRAAGHPVSVLTMTGGEQGGEAQTRAEESRRAAELMSARLFMLSLVDTSIGENGETIAEIARVIDEVKPTTIYTHTSKDTHQDHRNVHAATMVAARRVPRIFAYQAPSTGVEFRPNRFVAVDDFVEAKLEMIRAYSSQTAIRHYLDEDLLRATVRYWSRFSAARNAEPLEVLRDSDLGGGANDYRVTAGPTTRTSVTDG
jgi:LmbE family N-acetylglucosaminyl deacetylase/ActR/RegA family two-component response regulator